MTRTRFMISMPCPPTRSRSRRGRSARAIRQIGPGLILAASIVGTGELINTTGPGSQGRLLAALADPPELRDQGLRPGRARPVRDHPRQDDPGGLRHAARAQARGLVDLLALADHDADHPGPDRRDGGDRRPGGPHGLPRRLAGHGRAARANLVPSWGTYLCHARGAHLGGTHDRWRRSCSCSRAAIAGSRRSRPCWWRR